MRHWSPFQTYLTALSRAIRDTCHAGHLAVFSCTRDLTAELSAALSREDNGMQTRYLVHRLDIVEKSHLGFHDVEPHL